MNSKGRTQKKNGPRTDAPLDLPDIVIPERDPLHPTVRSLIFSGPRPFGRQGPFAPHCFIPGVIHGVPDQGCLGFVPIRHTACPGLGTARPKGRTLGRNHVSDRWIPYDPTVHCMTMTVDKSLHRPRILLRRIPRSSRYAARLSFSSLSDHPRTSAEASERASGSAAPMSRTVSTV